MSKSVSRTATTKTSNVAPVAVLDDPGAIQVEIKDVVREDPSSAQPKTRSPKSARANSDAAPKKTRSSSAAAGTKRFTAVHSDEGGNRQAELFYLQKQIQLQTQMVFILEDDSRIQGIVEWYDRQSIKVRGKSRVLIYKSAIKYLYKAGEVGVAPER